MSWVRAPAAGDRRRRRRARAEGSHRRRPLRDLGQTSRRHAPAGRMRAAGRPRPARRALGERPRRDRHRHGVERGRRASRASTAAGAHRHARLPLRRRRAGARATVPTCRRRAGRRRADNLAALAPRGDWIEHRPGERRMPAASPRPLVAEVDDFSRPASSLRRRTAVSCRSARKPALAAAGVGRVGRVRRSSAHRGDADGPRPWRFVAGDPAPSSSPHRVTARFFSSRSALPSSTA